MKRDFTHSGPVCDRIVDKRKLMVMESREKRRIEKPRVPRTATKLDTQRMSAEMGELGVDVNMDDEVRAHAQAHSNQ